MKKTLDLVVWGFILLASCAKPESAETYGRFDSVTYKSDQLSFEIKRATTNGAFEVFVDTHNGQTVNASTSLVSTNANQDTFHQLNGTLDGLIPVNGFYSGGSGLELYANAGAGSQRITNNDTRTILTNLAVLVQWRLPLFGPYSHIIYRTPGFQFIFDRPLNSQMKVSVLRLATDRNYDLLVASNPSNSEAIDQISGILSGLIALHGESPVDVGDPRYAVVVNSDSESSLLTDQKSLDLIGGLENEILGQISK